MISRSSDRLRLAIVLSHPIQYYSPWFRWMRQNTDLNFKVWYLSDFGLRVATDEKFGTTFAWDIDLTSGYEWETVPNVAPKPDTLRFNGLDNPELLPRLARDKPDALLLFGYKYRTHSRLIPWARLHRLPLIFRGDSHLLGRSRLPTLKRLALTLLYRQFAAVTYVGRANQAYFRAAAVPERKLFFAPHAVDQNLYRAGWEEHQRQAALLRNDLALKPETRVVLFAGKLIASKQPTTLLEAFLRTPLPNTVLVISGDGPEKASLQRRAEAASERVRFLPFANQSEMPARYVLADRFVLPSRGIYETWGLAINEAMHMGVPCLVSDHVGCQQDLVTDGETGWVFQADQPESLASKLKEALTISESDLARMKSSLVKRISSYSYDVATRGLRAAIQSAASTR